MIKVSAEVGSDSSRLTVAVRAESIRRALAIVEDRYPGGDVRLVHPIDPETFFVKDPAVAAGTSEPETALIVAERSVLGPDANVHKRVQHARIIGRFA